MPHDWSPMFESINKDTALAVINRYKLTVIRVLAVINAVDKDINIALVKKILFHIIASFTPNRLITVYHSSQYRQNIVVK